jgi:long-chain-fatty-acid--[acyl-carrier-protein] ligase
MKEALKGNQNGVLFLPNHPTVLTDPMLVCFQILVPFSVRPLVTEYMFYNPVFYWIMRFIDALPVPDFGKGTNPLKISRLEKTLKNVEDGLDRGDAFLIYPAGMTKQSPREILGGTFAVHQLLSKYPKTKVVLVRITGLWGSRFSRAYTKGQQVNLFEQLILSFKDVVKAFIFFMPRRDVTVEFQIAPKDFPVTASKNVINRYLEQWYNKPFEHLLHKGEPLLHVPYSPWKNEAPRIEVEKDEGLGGKVIPKEVEEEVIEKIAELGSIPAEQITTSQHLVADLNLDSLHLAELITFLETHYDIDRIEPQYIGTVAQALLAATHQLEIPEAKDPEWDTTAWEKPRAPGRLLLGDGKTIPDIFFDVCDRHLFDIAACDVRTGPITHYTMKSRILLLYKELKKLPGKHIGILLPASVGTEILTMACYLAGKVPVMINWTVGGRHLESVVELSKIETVLTSWSFLDRLDNVDLRPIQHIMVIMEELQATFSWWNMLSSPLKACIPSRWLKRLRWAGYWSYVRPDSEAVILFTSGTESMPKGVPLTHANVLSNIRATLQTVEFYRSDRLLCSLPPFHSFGFVLTGLLPLLSDVRAVFFPNPTDSSYQAKLIRKWGVTLLASAPTFLVNILRQGKKEPFDNVRAIVSGAEKPPEELYDLASISVPHAAVWEGYGITECSPIISANVQNDRSYGVGMPIPGVRIKIVHQDDFSQTLPNGEAGMILATGPNIFKGYLQTDVKSPFYEEGGVRWYVTGDIGLINEKGGLKITGRLKRFVKIGGEMISLGAIESSLAEVRVVSEGEGPQLAVCAKGEFEGKPRLILFSTKEMAPIEVNAILRQKGFSNLVRIDRVITLETIPLTGTGKIAYRDLETTYA